MLELKNSKKNWYMKSKRMEQEIEKAEKRENEKGQKDGWKISRAK